jgi:RNA polymerase sigma factor (sigma-70 family)
MLHNQLPDISYATGKHATLNNGGPATNGAAPTDRELLARLAAGLDESAFATLVRRHAPLVMGICVRVLRNFHDAEDACQATFLVLLRKAGTIDRPELLGNWLYGVAFRTAQKLRTSNARRRNREEQASQRHEAAPVAAGMEKDELAILDRELCRLPDKYRMPLVLCYLDGKTHHEVARDLGWPIGSVSARLARGLQMLRDRLATCRQRRIALWTVMAVIATALLMEGAALGGFLDTGPKPPPVQQNPQSEASPAPRAGGCGGAAKTSE